MEKNAKEPIQSFFHSNVASSDQTLQLCREIFLWTFPVDLSPFFAGVYFFNSPRSENGTSFSFVARCLSIKPGGNINRVRMRRKLKGGWGGEPSKPFYINKRQQQQQLRWQLMGKRTPFLELLFVLMMPPSISTFAFSADLWLSIGTLTTQSQLPSSGPSAQFTPVISEP